MARAYRFTLEPELVDTVTEYLVVGDDFADDVHEDIESNPSDFFGELVDDRYPGFVVTDWEEIDVPTAKVNSPFEML